MLRLSLPGLIAVLALFLAPKIAKAETPLDLARLTLKGLQPEFNEYAAEDSFITWKGVDGSRRTQNRSVCSTFYSLLLEKSYGYQKEYFEEWLGRRSPLAENYYDAIRAENGFMNLRHMEDVEEGDLIAIKYLDDEATTTGHVALVNAKPRLMQPTEPFIAGTKQYEIEIIDSALSGHGPTDTRLQADGSWDDGVGRGVMRVYADANGGIRGYTWSTFSYSEFHSQQIKPLVIGRLRH